MQNFRTSSLFHYTKLNNLKKILQEGMIPNFCKEEFPQNNHNYIVGIPMISFCDIPLTRTDEFTNRYGQHAIGLSKEWALRNQINPILYVSNTEIIESISFYKAYEQYLRSELEKVNSDGRQVSVNLRNPASWTNIKNFINYNNAQNANWNIWGYIKPYWGQHNEKSQCNYEENEWRCIIKEENGIEWKWGEHKYQEWRGDGQTKPQPTEELKSKRLIFSNKDITHLIVEKDSQIPQMIKYIESLDTIGGNEEEIFSDAEKKILISKIVSFERIKKDF